MEAIRGLYLYRNEFFKKDAAGNIAHIDWFGLVVIAMAIIAAILLIRFTYKNLAHKYHYKSKNLDPIVNNFTENADIQGIRLLAGDFNFFGGGPAEMDNNSQYKCLNVLQK